MKFLRFIVSSAFISSLIFTSNVVMATGCGDGVLQNETFDGSLIVRNENSCIIISSDIKGDLIVKDTDNVLLLNNKVGGRIVVDRTNGQEGIGIANVIANTVFTGNLAVVDHATANVIENETLSTNIRVNRNIKATVQKNIASQDLICRNNTDLSSFLNVAGEKTDCD